MLLKLIAAAFGKRGKSAPAAAPRYEGPQHRGFVAFVVDVERAHFIVPGDRIVSDQASLRLRAWLPALELSKRVPVCLVPLTHVERDPELRELGEVRAIVVGKFSVQRITGEPARFMALADWAQTMAAKVHVVADFCDDLAAASAMYDSSAPAAYQAQLLQSCATLASTGALREQLLPQAKFGVSVIEDPYERETAQAPVFVPPPKIRLAWFGVFGPPLMPFLTEAFSAVAGRISPRPAELRFITHVSQAGLARELGEKLRAVHPGFMLHFVPWSREAVAAELAKAHLVLLPQDASGAWGRAKSHNRLVETLRAGRFAIASPIPSYLEMKDYAWVGSSLGDGVLWALSHRNAVLAKVRAGQLYVEQRFAPHVIGERWAQALKLDAEASVR